MAHLHLSTRLAAAAGGGAWRLVLAASSGRARLHQTPVDRPTDRRTTPGATARALA